MAPFLGGAWWRISKVTCPLVVALLLLGAPHAATQVAFDGGLVTTPAPEPDQFENVDADGLEAGTYPMITINFPCMIADLTSEQYSAVKQDTFVHFTTVFDFLRDEMEIIDLIAANGGSIAVTVTFADNIDPVVVVSAAEALAASQIVSTCGTSVGEGTVGEKVVAEVQEKGTPPTTANPTPGPTADPTPGPTADPTPTPTADPTPGPTADLTSGTTADPTPGPTADPTSGTTADPTPGTTADPTPGPTADPTLDTTADPTPSPTRAQTSVPTEIERNPAVEESSPTSEPTDLATHNPSGRPTSPVVTEVVQTVEYEITGNLNDMSTQEEEETKANLLAAFRALAQEEETETLEIESIFLTQKSSRRTRRADIIVATITLRPQATSREVFKVATRPLSFDVAINGATVAATTAGKVQPVLVAVTTASAVTPTAAGKISSPNPTPTPTWTPVERHPSGSKDSDSVPAATNLPKIVGDEAVLPTTVGTMVALPKAGKAGKEWKEGKAGKVKKVKKTKKVKKKLCQDEKNRKEERHETSEGQES